jgi:hypothetical protein
MSLNHKIQSYLSLNNIVCLPGDYETGQPAGQEDQVLIWNSEKLGPQPTQDQLDIAWNAKLAADSAVAYKANRASEYPDFRDYLDGIVKGDQAQVQAYIDDCLAIKAKYPKSQ